MSSSCTGMCGLQLSLIFLPISLEMAFKCIIQIHVYFRRDSVQAWVRQDAQLNGSVWVLVITCFSGAHWNSFWQKVRNTWKCCTLCQEYFYHSIILRRNVLISLKSPCPYRDNVWIHEDLLQLKVKQKNSKQNWKLGRPLTSKSSILYSCTHM